MFLIGIIVSILTFGTQSTQVSAYNGNTYTGKVVEVVDGDTIKVLTTSGGLKFVKLLCVDSQGYNLAFDYMNNEIMGKDVILGLDITYPEGYNIWTYAYVYSGGNLVNQTLLEKGYAKINDVYNNSSKYKNMVVSSAFAQSKGIGIWDDNESIPYTSDHNYRDYYININTADEYTLRKYLIGVSDRVAKEIVRYRRRYDFNKVSDILNVPGVTTDIYYDNIYMMTTDTDINTATYEELVSLGRFTSSDADRILKYLEKKDFLTINELYQKGLVTRSKFDEVRNFIYVK